MRQLRVAVTFVLMLGLAACGSKNDAGGGGASTDSASMDSGAMPNVTGQKLDVAENNIKKAGFNADNIKIVGGGALGVVVKSNWTVCDQSPAAGQAVATTPRLTVDRSCDGTTSGSAMSSTETSSTAGSRTAEAPTSGSKETDETLTPKNNKDLAALLKVKDPGDPRVVAFAGKYLGRSIEFDGHIANVAPHGSSKTLEDVLVHAGNYNPNAAIGPNFQLAGVSQYNIPGGLQVGQKIRIKATVGEYDSGSQLFQLDPSPTTITARN